MHLRRRHGALAGAVTTALLLTSVLAGCSGEESGGAEEGPEPSASDAADDADDTDDTGDTDDEATAYLEVPEGVELTEPGTALFEGDSAVAAWTPRQDLVGVVEVTVTAKERARLTRDFVGYDVVNADPQPTPYFVRAEVENVGETDLGGRRLPIYGVDDDGRLVEPSDIDRAFAPCPGGTLPAVFAAGDTAETCLVFLMAPDTRLDDVMFRPPEGVAPLVWDGGVTPYEPPQAPDRRRPRQPPRTNQSEQPETPGPSASAEPSGGDTVS